jgi:hypothetical protein
MIIAILVQLCISLIYAQSNKTSDFEVIAKPHPKGMYRFNKNQSFFLFLHVQNERESYEVSQTYQLKKSDSLHIDRVY